MYNMAADLNKERALDALLTERTFSAAADKAGISRRTLYSFLHEDLEFAREYRARVRLLGIERAEREMLDRDAALDAIREIMGDSKAPAAVRLKAAERLLDVAATSMATVNGVAQEGIDELSGWTLD